MSKKLMKNASAMGTVLAMMIAFSGATRAMANEHSELQVLDNGEITLDGVPESKLPVETVLSLHRKVLKIYFENSKKHPNGSFEAGTLVFPADPYWERACERMATNINKLSTPSVIFNSECVGEEVYTRVVVL